MHRYARKQLAERPIICSVNSPIPLGAALRRISGNGVFLHSHLPFTD